jgi:4-amino-4-deoxy-L-arabinose transferase-like glycosyltransferase
MLLIFDIVRLYKGVGIGVIAAVILGLSNDFLRYSAVGRLDGPQAFFMTLALWGYVKAARDRKNYFLFVIGVALGLSFMLKGPMVLIMVPVIVIDAIMGGRAKLLISRYVWPGLILGVLFAYSWHNKVAYENPEFMSHYFGHEMTGRISGEWLESKSRLIFVRVLFEHYLPWILAAIYGLWIYARTFFNGKCRVDDTGQNPRRVWFDDGVVCVESEYMRTKEFNRLFIVWTVLVAIAVFIPPRMYGRYLVPLLVPLAGFSACGLGGIIKDKGVDFIRKKILIIAIIVSSLVFLVPFNRHKTDKDYNIKGISEIVKKELYPSKELPLYLVEIHAPKAMVYFYCGMESVFIVKPDLYFTKNNPSLVLTSKGGMDVLKKYGYVIRSSASDLVLAGLSSKGKR